MGQLSPILRNAVDGNGRKHLHFWCPGCDEVHGVTVQEEGQPNGWTWNGDADKPTFQPSILVTNGHYTPGFQEGDSCWCTFNAARVAEGKEPSVFKCDRCHSFVTDGQIQFLGDCTHALANQTVPLPAWSEGA